MISEQEQPIWFNYLELDENLNQYIRDDAPEEIKQAYANHLSELEALSESGGNISR